MIPALFIFAFGLSLGLAGIVPQKRSEILSFAVAKSPLCNQQTDKRNKYDD